MQSQRNIGNFTVPVEWSSWCKWFCNEFFFISEFRSFTTLCKCECSGQWAPYSYDHASFNFLHNLLSLVFGKWHSLWYQSLVWSLNIWIMTVKYWMAHLCCMTWSLTLYRGFVKYLPLSDFIIHNYNYK